MEEVKRFCAMLALLTIFFSSMISVSRADVCVSPRIKRARACGVVIDPYGMVIPNAQVQFGEGDTGSSTVSNIHGRFSAGAHGQELRVQVGAPGFQSVETHVGQLKESAESCKRPLYVMLTIGQQGCAMISLRKSDLLLAKKE